VGRAGLEPRDPRITTTILAPLCKCAVQKFTTGIRRRQVCGLRWESIDLDAGEITVHDNRVVVGGRAHDKAGGKTKSADHRIAIDRGTIAALRN